MCGITGFVTTRGEAADKRTLELMVDTLRHRGPDALGYHVDGPIALGVARLRVIDVASGDQPIANEDQSVHAVLNGELYNYRALRDDLARRGHAFKTGSDTEVLVHLWEEHGERSVDHLNGMFAVALWDHRRQLLFLARDRMGEKPLYYALVADGLIFASELRAMLTHPAVSRVLDLEGVSRYLAYDFVPDPHSILRGISKLPPGHTLTYQGGVVRTYRYWDIRFAPERDIDERAWAEDLARRFDAAVTLRLESHVPLGCFLSGGIDSTAVVATAVRHRPGLRTFSVGYLDSTYDERRYARLVAERLGTRHEEVVMSASDALRLLPRLGALMDEPLADMSFAALYLLAATARRTITVALTGDGGDELFGGYRTMAADWWHRLFARLPRGLRTAMIACAKRAPMRPQPLREFLRALDLRAEARNQALLGGLAPERHHVLLAPDVRRALVGFDPYLDITRTLAACDSSDEIERLIYRYCKLYLAGRNLVNTDRASMASGLELRAPFLDHEFVEFAGRIPPELKLRGLRMQKRLLKCAFADRIPPEILARSKQGFEVPFGAWFRDALGPLLQDVLGRARLRAGGIFDPDAVERLVREHIEGTRDHRQILWSLLVFELWRDHYLVRPNDIVQDCTC